MPESSSLRALQPLVMEERSRKSPGGGGGKLAATRTRKNQLPGTHHEATGFATAMVQLEDSWQIPVPIVSSNSSEMQPVVVSHAAWHEDSV